MSFAVVFSIEYLVSRGDVAGSLSILRRLETEDWRRKKSGKLAVVSKGVDRTARCKWSVQRVD